MRSYFSLVLKFKKSIDAGLLKIMSKMGISVLSSYRGGCNFETVGLSRTIVDDYFPGVVSKISGIGLTGLEKKIRSIHKEAFHGTGIIVRIGKHYRNCNSYFRDCSHLFNGQIGASGRELDG